MQRSGVRVTRIHVCTFPGNCNHKLNVREDNKLQ